MTHQLGPQMKSVCDRSMVRNGTVTTNKEHPGHNKSIGSLGGSFAIARTK